MNNTVWRWTRNFTVMKHHRHSIIVFLLALAYALSTAWFGVNFYDEGIIVTGGMRVLHGDIPHRDFASLYPYASYYISAAIQFVFGNGLLPFRLCAAIVFAGLCTLSYLFMIRMGLPPLYAILCCITLLLWTGIAPITLRAVFLSLFCTLLSLYVITGTYKHKYSISYLLLLSASIMRWDIALYGSIAWGVYRTVSDVFVWRKLLFTIVIVSLSVVLFPLFTLWAFSGETATIKAIEQTIIFPVFEFPSVRGLPFPLFFPRWHDESKADVLLASFALWGMIIVIIAAHVQWLTRKISFNAPNYRIALTLFVFMIGLMNQARVRSDFEHCVPALFPFFILIFTYISLKNLPKKNIFIITLCLISMPVALKGKQWFQTILYSPYREMWGNGIYDRNAQSYDSLVHFIQKKTSIHDRILMCPQQGQSNQSSDIFFYYAAQRIPVTYFHEFHPGITDKDDAQKQIINDCRHNNCRFIIRQNLKTNSSPRKPQSSPTTILDTFITNNYYTVCTIRDYTVMIPKQR